MGEMLIAHKPNPNPPPLTNSRGEGYSSSCSSHTGSSVWKLAAWPIILMGVGATPIATPCPTEWLDILLPIPCNGVSA